MKYPYNVNNLTQEKAKELLLDGSVNIKDVSNSVGYPDSNYFAKIFKKSVGMTPKEYRQKTLHNMLSKHSAGSE